MVSLNFRNVTQAAEGRMDRTKETLKAGGLIGHL